MDPLYTGYASKYPPTYQNGGPAELTQEQLAHFFFEFFEKSSSPYLPFYPNWRPGDPAFTAVHVVHPQLIAGGVSQ
jgi:hypothetical protein